MGTVVFSDGMKTEYSDMIMKFVDVLQNTEHEGVCIAIHHTDGTITTQLHKIPYANLKACIGALEDIALRWMIESNYYVERKEDDEE